MNMADLTIYKGKVKFFKADKGYGFIEPDDGSGDLFVHISNIHKDGLEAPRQGQRMSYNISEKNGKRSAVNLSFLPADE